MTTISREEFLELLTPEVQRAIAESVGRDPLQVALDRHIPSARLVSTQVKYLSRAAKKLPSYAAAQCIIPSLAFEQSSSEQCAAHKPLEGDSVLDLTCGLGVDAWYLSRRFRRVVTVERDPLLAEVARENFRRLGAQNIEVVNAASEDYVASCAEHFDWIYADPDRRSERGEKLVRLEDCSPNMIALMPRLQQLAGGVCIKNSPLFDVDEPQRLFGACGVEVVSLADECKEVMIYLDGRPASITATALGRGSFTAPDSTSRPPLPAAFHGEHYRYLIVPDVALQKARLARIALAGVADLWSDNGFGFATEAPSEGVLGRIFEIESIEPYDPKKLKRELKGRGVEIFKRDLKLSIDEVMKRAGCHAGSEIRLAMTKIEDKHWVIRLK